MRSGRPPKAHIMAAGLGTRLAPLTDRTAKPMAPIVNRPVMEHILRLLARHGTTEVCVNLHYYADDIRGYFGDGCEFGLQAHYSFEEKLLGTAGGTGGFRQLLAGDTFVVVSGDALTDIDISAFVAAHRRHGAVATIAVKEVDDPSRYGVVVHDDEGRVVGFQEKPSRAEARSHLCNCGIYAFEPAIFELIPPGAFVDYAKDVFPALLAADRPFYVWPLETYWNDVGSLREYRRGNFDALAGRVAVSLPGRELHLGVWVGEGTEVADDVEIVPPVLIGDGCRVASQARLVGPLVIGDGCTIGHGAVLEGVIHWDGTATGRGASLAGGIVGRAVTIGDHAIVHRGAVIGDGCAIAEQAVVKADARLAPQSAVAATDGAAPDRAPNPCREPAPRQAGRGRRRSVPAEALRGLRRRRPLAVRRLRRRSRAHAGRALCALRRAACAAARRVPRVPRPRPGVRVGPGGLPVPGAGAGARDGLQVPLAALAHGRDGRPGRRALRAGRGRPGRGGRRRPGHLRAGASRSRSRAWVRSGGAAGASPGERRRPALCAPARAHAARPAAERPGRGGARRQRQRRVHDRRENGR